MSLIDECYKQDINSIVYKVDTKTAKSCIEKVLCIDSSDVLMQDNIEDYDCFNSTIDNYKVPVITKEDLSKIIHRSIFIHGIYNGVYSELLKMLLNLNDNDVREWNKQYINLRNLKITIYSSLMENKS